MWILISILLVAALGTLASTVRFVFAELDLDNPLYRRDEVVSELLSEIENKKDKANSLKEASEKYAQKIEEQQAAAQTLENQLGILDNLVTKVQLDIAATQTDIDTTELEIEATKKEIENQEQQIESQKTQLAEFIQIVHKNDSRSLLETLILNDSLSEFFNELNVTQELQSDIKKSVDRLYVLRDALEVQEQDLVRKQDELKGLKDELKEQELKLEDERNAKVVLLEQTQQSEERYQRLLIEARQIQNEIDSDILNIEDEIKKKIARLRSGSSSPDTTLLGWPTDGRYITSYFHDPDYPYRHVFEHNAIDIRAKQGTPLKAVADGYVARAKDNGYGYSYITIIHDNGISTVYGHVSRIYVKEGEFVSYGDVVGLSGGTPGTLGAGPFVTGPHLHFEVRLNGIPVNPLDYLP